MVARSIAAHDCASGMHLSSIYIIYNCPGQFVGYRHPGQGVRCVLAQYRRPGQCVRDARKPKYLVYRRPGQCVWNTCEQYLGVSPPGERRPVLPSGAECPVWYARSITVRGTAQLQFVAFTYDWRQSYRMLQNLGHNHIFTRTALCNRLLLPDEEITPKIV